VGTSRIWDKFLTFLNNTNRASGVLISSVKNRPHNSIGGHGTLTSSVVALSLLSSGAMLGGTTETILFAAAAPQSRAEEPLPVLSL
jgi:hypothetical protein